MTKTFEAQVADWVTRTSEALTAVARQSIQDVINEASLTKGKGGKMPIDTGFLRASGRSSLTGWPSGPDENPEKLPYPSEDNYSLTGTIQADLAALDLGDTFYFGWTAVYALRQEMYNGFMGSALQNWQSIVDDNVIELRRRFKI